MLDLNLAGRDEVEVEGLKLLLRFLVLMALGNDCRA
jgi:hypothetical protein